MVLIGLVCIVRVSGSRPKNQRLARRLELSYRSVRILSRPRWGPHAGAVIGRAGGPGAMRPCRPGHDPEVADQRLPRRGAHTHVRIEAHDQDLIRAPFPEPGSEVNADQDVVFPVPGGSGTLNWI